MAKLLSGAAPTWCRAVSLAVLVALLGGCASTPLPDYRFYRPVTDARFIEMAKPALDQPLEVDVFRANGVFGERPIVYSLSDEPQKLSQYHYQLWTDPPGTILQQRFIDVLRGMKAAPLVTSRVSPRSEPTKLVGMIERLERVRLAPGQWTVAVALRIRVETHRGAQALLERRYQRVLPVEGAAMAASVEQFAVAVDDIAAEVARDLSAIPSAKPSQ